MKANDLAVAQDKHPTARRWEEWRQLEQQPGGSPEPQQEPVQFAPIVPYEYPTSPVPQRPEGTATPEPIQRDQDPEQLHSPAPNPEVVHVPVSPVEVPRTLHPVIESSTPAQPAVVVHHEPVHIIHPVQIDQKPAETARKTIPPQAKINSETIPKNSQTIPNQARNEPEWSQGPEPENALHMPEIEDGGEVGRKRKNEDTGIYGDISIQDIILFRYITKRHWPDLSGDMRAWYEWFYFKRPAKHEKPYRGKTYEQHKRAYDRGRAWIAGYEADRNASDATTQTVGHSGNSVIPFPQRQSS